MLLLILYGQVLFYFLQRLPPLTYIISTAKHQLMQLEVNSSLYVTLTTKCVQPSFASYSSSQTSSTAIFLRCSPYTDCLYNFPFVCQRGHFARSVSLLLCDGMKRIMTSCTLKKRKSTAGITTVACLSLSYDTAENVVALQINIICVQNTLLLLEETKKMTLTKTV